MRTLYTTCDKMDGGKEVGNINTPQIVPLTEKQLKPFLDGKESIAIITKDGKSFVGDVLKINHEIDSDETVTKLDLTFRWLVEVAGVFVDPVPHGMRFMGEKKEVRSFAFPRKKTVSERREGMLFCCCRDDSSNTITLSMNRLHIEAVRGLGKDCRESTD